MNYSAKKSSNSTKQYIQNNIIQQINPKYDINVSSTPMYKLDNVAIQNARWKSKRITQICHNFDLCIYGNKFCKFHKKEYYSFYY